MAYRLVQIEESGLDPEKRAIWSFWMNKRFQIMREVLCLLRVRHFARFQW
jgi:hypothetical protein